MSAATASRFLRLSIYVLLVVSAGTLFFGGERLWAAAGAGALPGWVPLLPAIAFTLFVVIYTLDRLLLIKRRRYPMGRAFFQIALAVIFLSLLLPPEVSRLQDRRRQPPADATLRLLRHNEPEVRSAACELLAWRGELGALDELGRLADTDPQPAVRQACAEARRRLEAIATGP